MSQYPKREGIMLCYPFEEKRLLKWNSPVIVQPKLDGLRCRAHHTYEGWRLISSQGNEFHSVPHINAGLEELTYNNKINKAMELDGELYAHGKSFEQIVSIVKRNEPTHGNMEDIKFHLFDLVNSEPQLKRINQIVGMTENLPPEVEIVPSALCNGLEQIMQKYKEILALGYEGIIVRHLLGDYIRRRSTFVMKFKPKKFDWYPIVGYQEEISQEGEPKGRLGSLQCMGDNDLQEFSVGTGLSAEQREELWAQRENLIGKTVHVSYQHITPGRGVPRFPVFVEIIDM